MYTQTTLEIFDLKIELPPVGKNKLLKKHEPNKTSRDHFCFQGYFILGYFQVELPVQNFITCQSIKKCTKCKAFQTSNMRKSKSQKFKNYLKLKTLFMCLKKCGNLGTNITIMLVPNYCECIVKLQTNMHTCITVDLNTSNIIEACRGNVMNL